MNPFTDPIRALLARKNRALVQVGDAQSNRVVYLEEQILEDGSMAFEKKTVELKPVDIDPANREALTDWAEAQLGVRLTKDSAWHVQVWRNGRKLALVVYRPSEVYKKS